MGLNKKINFFWKWTLYRKDIWPKKYEVKRNQLVSKRQPVGNMNFKKKKKKKEKKKDQGPYLNWSRDLLSFVCQISIIVSNVHQLLTYMTCPLIKVHFRTKRNPLLSQACISSLIQIQHCIFEIVNLNP